MFARLDNKVSIAKGGEGLTKATPLAIPTSGDGKILISPKKAEGNPLAISPFGEWSAFFSSLL
jgi:hypothetical protein